MLKFMLHTDISVFVLKKRPENLLESFNRNSGKMCISSITHAELMHGVYVHISLKDPYPDHDMQQIADFISRLQVLEYGTSAAAQYGIIRGSLEQSGKPIDVNDLHIAAHARSEELVLVTNNLAEFERIEGLELENWV